ncbi:tetratricopeptide repeat protein [Granulicella aggregans]|nr:tetratricopeptide repeat protein [Granulicella aggregans]
MNFRVNFALNILVVVAWCATSPYIQAQAPEASLIAVRQSINQREFSTAETLLRSELERLPTSPDVHFLLGLVLFYERRPSDSLAEYTLGARFRTPGADELVGVASDYILMKDYDDAERWLTQATELAPQMAKAWYLLGRTQFNENRVEGAEISFLTCLRIDAHNVKAEYNLGLIFEKTQRLDQAQEAYEKAIKWQETIGIKDPQPFLDLGMLLRQQGHVGQALPYLLAAKEAGPRNPMTFAEIALSYEQLGRFDEAITELNQALLLSPDTEALHFFLGRVYRRAGRVEEAKGEFAEAANLSGAKSNEGVPNEELFP